MAATRRGFIYGVFVLSLLSISFILLSLSSDRWVASSGTTELQDQDSTVRYGLFSGMMVQRTLSTPVANDLYVTCVPSVGACAVSCKTDSEARRIEVEALANSSRPTTACVAVTEVDYTNPLPGPAVIPFALYVCLLIAVFLHLVFAAISAALAITNATRNPTEPILGLPGCLWCNVVTAVLGLVVMLLWGVYWATSTLQQHLAISIVAVGLLVLSPGLGYSYWVLTISILCNLGNVGLIMLRSYLLDRDPTPSTIKVENHSDDNANSH